MTAIGGPRVTRPWPKLPASASSCRCSRTNGKLEVVDAPTLLFWLACANVAMVAGVAAILTYSGCLVRRLKDAPLTARDAWPSVSVIAPARNEARNIEQAVRSLLALDYPLLQVTVVDDRSTDGTGAILDRLAEEFPRLNIVHLHELPAGWLGKNHALQWGADRSNGEWLLFTDADVVFEPTTLKRGVGYALEHNLDHLTGTPDVHVTSWWLKSFCATFAMYFTLFVKPWLVRNPRSSAHAGIGAFNLVRAATYQAAGGHRRIALRPDDDLKLGKVVKLAGGRQDLVQGTELITVEWYSSVQDLVRGLEKNAFAGVDYQAGMIVWSTFYSLLFNVWPYVAVFVTTGPTRWLNTAVALTLWALTWSSARAMRLPWSCALAYPLMVLLFTYIQWRTMLLNVWQGGLRWRDTFYSLEELRANRV